MLSIPEGASFSIVCAGIYRYEEDVLLLATRLGIRKINSDFRRRLGAISAQQLHLAIHGVTTMKSVSFPVSALTP